MGYLIFGAIFVIVLILVLHRINIERLKRQRDKLHSEWGKANAGPYYFERIKKYADLGSEPRFHRLSEQTIEDIDFYGLFSIVDRTTSKVGQQFLFRKLLEPTNDRRDSSEDLIELFIRDENAREQVQLELFKLSGSDAHNLPSLLQGNMTQKPSWFNLLPLNMALIALLLLLSFSSPIFLLMLIFPLTINMLIHYWNRSNAFYFVSSLPQLNLLINVSRRLTKLKDLFGDKDVERSVSELRTFQVSNGLISLDNKSGVQGELGLLATYFLDLVKAVFLIEVFMFFKILKEIERRRNAIITLFNYVGNIDASISIASLRCGDLKTCIPVLTSNKKDVTVENMYHPLIKKCKGNSLSINHKSILITGSNMSGKSTFLRTFAINSICAQTIHTCFADQFESPVFKQFSSIRLDDSLFEGTSYYFQEVKTMGSLIAQVTSEHANLFILDEVFKGTNAVERVAAAKAILSYLNRNDNVVMVATHDMELSDMLSDEYDLYHFTDKIENGQLQFDHTIKPGRLTTRNAIKILELSKYPEEIVEEAGRISARLVR